MIDQAKVADYLARRRDAQNLGLGILGGAIGAALGAISWGALTVLTHGWQIGWMAVGVGFLTGFFVRTLGKGMDRIFGVVGAVFALAGCVAGNLLTIVIAQAAYFHVSPMDVAGQLTLANSWQALKDNFNVIDLLFYAFALYAGYSYSFHRISPQELDALKQPEAPPQADAGTPPAAAPS